MADISVYQYLQPLIDKLFMACQGVLVEAYNPIGVGWTNELGFDLACDGTKIFNFAILQRLELDFDITCGMSRVRVIGPIT